MEIVREAMERALKEHRKWHSRCAANGYLCAAKICSEVAYLFMVDGPDEAEVASALEALVKKIREGEWS